MPSSSAHSRDRRDRHRTSHLPKLDIPQELEETQSPSPRSELLSPTSTDRHRSRSTNGHGSSSRKHKGHDSRSSHKHSSGQSSHRRRADKSSASHRELVDTIAHGDDLDRQLHKTLEATVRRLEEEARKARDLEKVTKETARRFMEVNEGRLTAQKEASEASRALREEQLRLEEARKEIERTRAMMRDLAKQKEEAEESAARARAKARKLQQRQLVMQAREEGRKMGFEAGIKQAQEEYESVAPYEPSTRSRQRHRRTPTPPPPPGSGTDEQDDLGQYYNEGNTMGTDDIRSPVREAQPHLDMPQAPLPAVPPMQPNHNEVINQMNQTERRVGSPASSIPVERYAITIPSTDEPVNSKQQPREEWVTAQKHKEMTGAETTPRPTPHMSLRDQLPAPPMPDPALAVSPELIQQVQESRVPMMIYPTGPVQGRYPQPYQVPQEAPQPSSASTKKSRFPSLAKTKSKAASWYRSFSLRRKNRPVVIDPDDEDEEEVPIGFRPPLLNPTSEQLQNQPKMKAPGSILPAVGQEEDPRMYSYQPKPAQKWYVPPSAKSAKSVKSRHSRIPSYPPGAPLDHRHSVASTRISQLDMVNSAPMAYQGDVGSISGRSTTARNLAQKLSSIQEDPRTPGSKYVGGIAGYGAPIPAPSFAGSEIGSTRTGRRRPPGITVQNPNGLENSAVHMGHGRLAPPGPLQPSASALSRSTSNSGDINIDVQPATAAPTKSAGIPRSMAQTHLTPNYQPVYAQSTASRRSRQSGHGGGHRVTQSYSEPPQPPPIDTHSIQSGHSRAQSAQAETGPYPPELVSKSTQSIHQLSRGMDSAGTGYSSQFLETPTTEKAVHRSPSKSSMHSKYDPDTYLDPAYFNAYDAKGKGKGKMRAF